MNKMGKSEAHTGWAIDLPLLKLQPRRKRCPELEDKLSPGLKQAFFKTLGLKILVYMRWKNPKALLSGTLSV